MDMLRYEAIGLTVIGLTAVLSLVVIIAKPFKELTKAIHSLEKLMEKLVILQDNQETIIVDHEERIRIVEKSIHALELKSASNPMNQRQ